MKRLGFWSLFTVTMAFYATIVFWSLPQIAAQANGLTPFDLRPGGYTFEEAREFLSALSPSGLALYLGTQHLLDAFYPPLMSLTLFFAISALRKPIGHWKWAIASLALPSAVFDIVENLAVGRLLEAGPSVVTPEMVSEASWWTVLKSGSTTLAMSVLLVVLAIQGLVVMRSKFQPGSRVRPI